MNNIDCELESFNIIETEELEDYFEPHRFSSSFSAYGDLDESIYRIMVIIGIKP